MALAQHRNRQPLRSLCGFDSIAVPPPVPIELDAVIKYKDIRLLNLMKIPATGNVGRLQDDALHDRNHLTKVLTRFPGISAAGVRRCMPICSAVAKPLKAPPLRLAP